MSDVPAPQEPQEPQEPTRSPEDIEARRVAYFQGGDGLSCLDDPTPLGADNALQKLGKPPFERSARTKFRLLGFLATVYEHASEDVAHRISRA
jgi:hypothetical protein